MDVEIKYKANIKASVGGEILTVMSKWFSSLLPNQLVDLFKSIHIRALEIFICPQTMVSFLLQKAILTNLNFSFKITMRVLWFTHTLKCLKCWSLA